MAMTSVSREEWDDEKEDEEQDELSVAFRRASAHVRSKADALDQTSLLYLYARYKQAIDGPCDQPKPGLLDFGGRKKWDAWMALGDLDRARAKREYVEKVAELDPQWRPDAEAKKGGGGGGDVGGFGLGVSRPMIDSKDDEDAAKGANPWFSLVKEGDVKAIENLLLTCDGCPNSLITSADADGMTALHWAADRGHAHLIRFLLEKITHETHPFLNRRDAQGQTALHYAYQCGHSVIVRLLLDAGVDQTIRDNEGNRAEDLADLS